jgi:hypothetical protein
LPSRSPSPQALNAGPLNITVPEGKFRRAILGRAASFAPVGWKIGCLTPARTVGIVMFIGARARQEG